MPSSTTRSPASTPSSTATREPLPAPSRTTRTLAGTGAQWMQGEPTAVELRVPAAASPDSAPMGSAKQWSVVANNAAAGTNVVLTPSGDVSSRFVLVYLTKLPKVDGNKYRGGIAEVEVSS